MMSKKNLKGIMSSPSRTLIAWVASLVFVVITFGLTAVCSYGMEGGRSANPGGADDWPDCLTPPPGGLYWLLYSGNFWSDRFNDGHGRRAVPKFSSNFTLAASRIGYMSKKKIFGADLGASVIIPFARVQAKIETPQGRQSETRTGLYDIVLGPYVLGWHGKNWHALQTLQIYVPTGSYDKDRLVNLSNNYWTIEPVFAFAYFGDNGFDATAKFKYDINTKNMDSRIITPSGPKDVNYLSGQALDIDYAIGQRFKNFRIGVTGNLYKQITDDEVDGDKIRNKSQSFSVGPAITYEYKYLFFELKFQKDFWVRNRPVMDKLWFKFAMPLAVF